MIRFPGKKAFRPLACVAAAVVVSALAWPSRGQGQAKPADHAKYAFPDTPGTSTKASAAANGALADQLAELRAKVAALEAALSRKGQGLSTAPQGGAMAGMGMGIMGRMGGGGTTKPGGGGAMPMMDDDGMEVGAMAGGPPGSAPGGRMGMGMMDDASEMGMMGMGAMGKATGMAGMAVPSALPGFPGASHLYHLGATGFFLNHEKHAALDAAQKAALNRIKEKSLLDAATARRKVDAAEQELWQLTAADEPEADAIEAKVREVEKARGDQRLAFIRAVGEAAKVLTPEQRQQLLGVAGADAAPAP